jgi:hypothetical protein
MIDLQNRIAIAKTAMIVISGNSGNSQSRSEVSTGTIIQTDNFQSSFLVQEIKIAH